MKKRVHVPPEIMSEVAQIISQLLKDAEVEWERLTQRQKSMFYTQWTNNQQIRTLLGVYVDNIRGYLKDDIMRHLQEQRREVEDIAELLEKLLAERWKIEIVDTVECRKTATECRLLWRLKGNAFVIVVGGLATMWRSLLIRTIEWDIASRKRLKGIIVDREPVLILFRAVGDSLGRTQDQILVKQIAKRCGVELIIIPPKQRPFEENISTQILPLFAEQENS